MGVEQNCRLSTTRSAWLFSCKTSKTSWRVKASHGWLLRRPATRVAALEEDAHRRAVAASANLEPPPQSAPIRKEGTIRCSPSTHSHRMLRRRARSSLKVVAPARSWVQRQRAGRKGAPAAVETLDELMSPEKSTQREPSRVTIRMPSHRTSPYVHTRHCARARKR